MNDVTQYRLRAPRQFDTKFKIGASGPLPPSMADWPAELQDAVFAAMERIIEQTTVKELAITAFSCTPMVVIGMYECRMTLTEVLKDTDVTVSHAKH